MTAGRRSAVTDLNHRARNVLQDHGHLGPTVLVHRANEFAVGDQIMTLRTNRRLGLTNGRLGTVEGLAPAGDGLRVRFTGGGM